VKLKENSPIPYPHSSSLSQRKRKTKITKGKFHNMPRGPIFERDGIINIPKDEFQLITLTARNFGHSLGFIIPHSLAGSLDLKSGQKIDVAIRLSSLPQQIKIKFTEINFMDLQPITSKDYVDAFLKSKHKSVKIEGINPHSIYTYLYRHPEHPAKVRFRHVRKKTAESWLIRTDMNGEK